MHAHRLENALLRESLSDLRAGYANPIVRFAHESTQTHGNLAFGENILALRLENASLRESLSDLRAGYANPIVRFAHEMGSRRVSKKGTGALMCSCSFFGDPYGNRTHVTAVKGRCLNRLTNGPGSGNWT